MNIASLCSLAQKLTSLIDHGQHGGVSIQEVRQHILARDVIPWLHAKHPELGFDVDLLGKGEGARAIHERLDSLLNAYGGDERKRWGIEHSGLCLLLAWVIELIAMPDEGE